MARQLDLIDNFVANGQNEFTFEEARELLGGSRGATLERLTPPDQEWPFGSCHPRSLRDSTARIVGDVRRHR